MKKLALALVFVVAACGGGGGDGDSPAVRAFNFFGNWVISLQATSNTCGIPLERTSGALFVTIDQSGNIVTVDSRGVIGSLSGLADSDSFRAAGAESPTIFLCPDSSTPANITTVLNYSDTSGAIAGNVELSFFGTCPGFSDQCELSYSGQAIRTSGQESSSGVVVATTQSTEPEIF